jgi:hypothetical protein
VAARRLQHTGFAQLSTSNLAKDLNVGQKPYRQKKSVWHGKELACDKFNRAKKNPEME